MRKSILIGLLFVGIVAFFYGCRIEDKHSERAKKSIIPYELSGKAQGTSYSIKYYSKEEIDLRDTLAIIFEEIDRCFSLWRDDSEIVRLNTAENSYELYDPKGYFAEVFKLSKEIHRSSNGAFNPALHPLISAWGFSKRSGIRPTENQIDSLITLCSFDPWNMKDNYIQKEQGSIDFNAIAQGYTVDELAGALERFRITDYFIEVGGETRVKGEKPNGEKWRIGIDKPLAGNERAIQEVLTITDKAIVTSGSYRKFIEIDGRKYAHTINPASGYPAMNSLLSVTLIMDNCARADANATAMMVMGLEEAIDFAENLDGLEAFYFIYDDGGKFKTYESIHLKDYLKD